jgi:NAD(P)-dependent dehydrogenase (short-subunit alcohol dehydrogenase family)
VPILKLSETTAVVTRGQPRLWPGHRHLTCRTGGPGGRHLDELHEELGTLFIPLVAELADTTLAVRTIATYRPGLVVLNAGATPHAAPLQEQTWEGFSENWEADVQHVFRFLREALSAPLHPGSVVVSFSSGAALRGPH